MPRRPALSALACALALALVPSGAGAQGVSVRGRAAVEARAGGTATAAFRVENAGARPTSATARVRLPAGWSLAAPPEPLSLAPGGVAVWLLPFRVPGDAAAGTYPVHLAEAGGAADSVRVTVTATRALEARVSEAPRFVAAGDSISLRVRVRNAGNVAETVRVTLAAPEGGRGASASPAVTLVLAPGAEGDADFRVATAAGQRTVTRRRLAVRAVGAGDEAPSVSADAVVEVVPRGERGAGRPTLPAEVRVRMNGASGGVVPSVGGAGTLGQDGARVDFLLRGPERTSRLSRPDEYRLSLATPRFELRLGDQAYGLTPLTEPGTFGFGGEAAARLGPLTARGYAVSDRRGDGAVQGGGALEMRLGRAGLVGGGVLFPRRGGALATGRVRLSAGPFAALDAEAAGGGDGGAAHAVSLSGAVPGLSYHLRHQAADGDFGGAARGVEVAEGRVSLSLPGRAYVTGEATRRASSPLSPGGARETREGRVRAGVGGVVAVEARATEQEDARRGPWEARAVRASATARLGAATLTPSVEVGTGAGADGEARPFRRAAATLAVDAGDVSLAASVDVRDGRAAAYDAEGTAVTGSLRATARPLPGTLVRAEVRGGRRGDGRQARFADVTVDQHVARGHRLVGRVQLAEDGAGGTAEPEVTLDYVVPVGVPLRRDGATGAAGGRLYDAATGAPLAGVLVRVGDRSAVTDARGRWSVAGLAPGVHAVELDRLSLGAGFVPASPQGPEARVRGGGDARVDVGVVRAGRIAGRVLRADSAAAARGEPGVPFPAAVVVLAGPGEEVRRRVDADGRFDLPGLRPGTWSARVDGVPPHHRADPAEATVSLAPGGAADVTLRVVPVARPLVLVDGGTLVAGAARPRRGDPAPARPASPAPVVAAARDAASAVAARDAVSPAPAPARTAGGDAGRAAAAPARARPSPPAPLAVPEMPAEYAAMYRESLAVYERYEVQEGDAGLVAIALFVYHDGTLWPKLWLANVDLLPDPDALEPGMVLRVPAKAPLTPAERAAVAAREAARRR